MMDDKQAGIGYEPVGKESVFEVVIIITVSDGQ